ncbi:type II toxin-antitoxin system RelE/ParE family toxin [Botrimarina colliarenosi]|uniref:type II toxin-antitoxin system RelE/ParE family toxin n=1 Tax=Botrimarina colliarenosi TaxID=2528001 RepID=UPI0018D33E60|nr:type II toxin-antitoxin system RelE/ParE family toxin [Botrimarina colliarenosi]
MDANGDSPVQDWLDGLHKEIGIKEAKKVRNKFKALFNQMAANGEIPNPSRFSGERGDIHAFKFAWNKRLYRIACFQDGKKWVLTHGFVKPGAQKGKGKWPTEELDRADRIQAEHQATFATRQTPQ